MIISGFSGFLRHPEFPVVPEVKNPGFRKNLWETRIFSEDLGFLQTFSQNRMEKYALVLILQTFELVR